MRFATTGFFSTFAPTKSLMRHRSSQRLKNVAASLYGSGPCDTVKAVVPGVGDTAEVGSDVQGSSSRHRGAFGIRGIPRQDSGMARQGQGAQELGDRHAPPPLVSD